MANLLAAIGGHELTAQYDGYASCPITTARNRMLLVRVRLLAAAAPDRARSSTPPTSATTCGCSSGTDCPFLYWNLMLTGRA